MQGNGSGEEREKTSWVVQVVAWENSSALVAGRS